DAAGRRQYRYHDLWREQRDQDKHDRVREFGTVLPRIREVICRHLDGRGLTRDRVLAAAIRLIDLGFFRPGGEEYADENGTFGLAVSEPAAGRDAARKRAIARVVQEVAGYLGNTPAVARASYIDPRIVELYEEGRTIASALGELGKDCDFGDLATRDHAEKAVVKLLARQA